MGCIPDVKGSAVMHERVDMEDCQDTPYDTSSLPCDDH